MELPQPRPFGGSEGRKATHDFLSLYSPVQQDPRSPQGNYLKTHDFLQPLERVDKNGGKEEQKVETTAAGEKAPASAPAPSGEHILPGGIGTYSISYFSQRVPKPEGTLFTTAQTSSTERNDENSNCSSYTGSGFTFWDESAVKKGKTGKENTAAERHVLKEAGVNIGGGQWTNSMERPSQSPPSHRHNNITTFSTLSSPQPSLPEKNQSFMKLITSARNPQDDEDDEEEFMIKKEPSSHSKANLTVKVDGKSVDQKPNTPRSKHSATEQRRRSKINDRFQTLREIIPNSDQKRDKASFLLEVIEYIQFLQEKVHKYEGPYQGWNPDPSKSIPWINSNNSAEGFIRQPQGTNTTSSPPLMFSTNFEEKKIGISPVIPMNGQNYMESDINTNTGIKEGVNHAVPNKAASLPLPLHPNVLPFGLTSSAAAPLPVRHAPDTDKTASHPQSQFWQSRSSTTDCALASDKVDEKEMTIESGTINISSAYSQGLLNTLTQALQNSGVDLSQASISVQIDLGKRGSGGQNSSASTVKDADVQTSNQLMPRSNDTSMQEESDHARKRHRTCRN